MFILFQKSKNMLFFIINIILQPAVPDNEIEQTTTFRKKLIVHAYSPYIRTIA